MCVMRLHTSWSGGTTTFWSVFSHRPRLFAHCWCFCLALNQGRYCQHAIAISPLSEVGSPALARLRNVLSGSSDSYHSPTLHLSSQGWDSASMGVLFFPAT